MVLRGIVKTGRKKAEAEIVEVIESKGLYSRISLYSLILLIFVKRGVARAVNGEGGT